MQVENVTVSGGVRCCTRLVQKMQVENVTVVVVSGAVHQVSKLTLENILQYFLVTVRVCYQYVHSNLLVQAPNGFTLSGSKCGANGEVVDWMEGIKLKFECKSGKFAAHFSTRPPPKKCPFAYEILHTPIIPRQQQTI